MRLDPLGRLAAFLKGRPYLGVGKVVQPESFFFSRKVEKHFFLRITPLRKIKKERGYDNHLWQRILLSIGDSDEWIDCGSYHDLFYLDNDMPIRRQSPYTVESTFLRDGSYSIRVRFSGKITVTTNQAMSVHLEYLNE